MNAHYNYPDASKAVIVPLSEEQLARRVAREGGKVRMVLGRYWLEVLPGLYDGIHWLSRHTVEEVSKPALLCWGYRAALHNAESLDANGAIPMHLITDVEAYDVGGLPSRTRRELRQFQTARCEDRSRQQSRSLSRPRLRSDVLLAGTHETQGGGPGEEIPCGCRAECP